MARRKGIGQTLTEAHADAVRDGTLTIAELADQLGVSKQSIHATFKKRGWATTAAHKVENPGSAISPSASALLKAPGATASSRKPQTGSKLHAPSSSPPGGLPNASVPPIPNEASSDDLAELARHELANAALLAIARCRDILAAGQLGAGGLRQVVAAMQGAAQQLERCGVEIDATAGAGVSALVISEMSASEVEEVRRQADLAFTGDEQDDDMAVATNGP